MQPYNVTILTRHSASSLLFLAAFMLISVLALSGCNTVSGMGEDLSAAGKGIDQTSEATQEKMTGKPRAQQQGNSDYQAGPY